jgi:hypothetical protein
MSLTDDRGGRGVTLGRMIACTGTIVPSHALREDAEAPRQARAFVRDHLCPLHGDEALGAAQLVASEMVSHLLVHGSPPFELGVACSVTEIRVTVTDHGERPRVESDEVDALRAALLEKVTREMGVEEVGGRRTWWATLPTGHLPRERPLPGY